MYSHQLQMSNVIKMRQGINRGIIPVFHGMTNEETGRLTEEYPSLAFLTRIKALYTNDKGWEAELINVFDTTSLGEYASPLIQPNVCFM